MAVQAERLSDVSGAIALSWTVEQEGFDAAREHGMESIFSLGNGYLGVRGALPTPLPGSRADLFVAGVYDRKLPPRFDTEMEFVGGRADYAYGELVSWPSPFRARVTLDDATLDLVGPRCHSLSRTLDLRGAILQGHVDYDTDVDRRVVLRTRRCASLADVHLLLQELTVCFVNYSGNIELDTTVGDPDLAGNHPHAVPLPAPGIDPSLHVDRFATRASGVEVCMVSRTLLEGEPRAAVRFRLPATIGRILSFRRFIAVFTSYDTDDPLGAATRHVATRSWEDFDRALTEHARRWSEVWQRADVRIPGSPATEQALRFDAYHLVSAAAQSPRASLGARALTGRAYEGHVFWDVEMFALPFYLHTFPHVARNLLAYRHRTLDGARRRARELGCRGAAYAWESTVTGDDVTPRAVHLKTTGQEIPIFSSQQVHVTADVALALWRYWEATRDRELMRTAGVEILVETARFWASRVTKGPRHYHLRDVMGPDEYHHSVSDNAYTNWLARENLECAVEAVAWLEREEPSSFFALAERLVLGREESPEWAAIARALYCPGPNAAGVIEQFEGFFALETIDDRAKASLSRLFDWERINRIKLIKQADVLMLLHVLPEAFSRQVVAANYRYYEPLTDHASSLSPGIHAAIAARIGVREDMERYFRESLWLDLTGKGNSALGVHPACMGATWQALVFGMLGVRFTEAGPVRDAEAPACLPSSWEGAALSLMWRGRPYEVRVAREKPP